MERILAEKTGRGHCQQTKYFVKWLAFGPEHNFWISQDEAEELKALDIWQEWQQPTHMMPGQN